MSLALYAHPFSSYCWKVLIALWETGTPFEYRRLDDPAHLQRWQALSPFGRMPLLVDGDRVLHESTIIIESLQLRGPCAVPLIPADPAAALNVRLLDRLSDQYLMTPMQTIVFDAARGDAPRDPHGVSKARELLDTAYGWWDAQMQGREWAADTFSLADCATAPALFYADWTHPIPRSLAALHAYRARLLARPAVRRAVDEARPFRAYFPLGDPGRD